MSETNNENWGAETDTIPATPTSDAANAALDAFDEDLNDIEIGQPVLADGIYRWSLTATIEDAKTKRADGTTGQSLVVKHVLAQDGAKSIKGQDVPKGRVVLTAYIGITPGHTEGKQPYTVDMIKQKCAQITQFVQPPFGKGESSVSKLKANPTILNGKWIQRRVTVKPEGTENGRDLPTRNELGRAVKVE